MTASTRITLTLYQHCDGAKNALLLSSDGRHTVWIPRSLIDEPAATRPVKIDGVALQKGEFSIEDWKAEEAGFIGHDDDDRQEELAL